jgi:hypothetical protein
MPSMDDAIRGHIERLLAQMQRSTGVFEVATTSPDFTVYLDGGDLAVPAEKVAGLSYSVGTKGRYLLDQGQQPFCWPTA